MNCSKLTKVKLGTKINNQNLANQLKILYMRFWTKEEPMGKYELFKAQKAHNFSPGRSVVINYRDYDPDFQDSQSASATHF